ncbi:MAG: 4Fe-4S binding protein [Proteobacteria bacterium]|nr:4Fe-4S binding protein [Pseudomonadota bacterium]
MTEDVYCQLARVLDTLPNGFPQTESGLEIKILKKIFTPEEADLFRDLRLAFETPEDIAQRTGRPLEETAERLEQMRWRGQIFGIDFGEVKVYKMLPWMFGIYEFQLKRMDKELAAMCEQYYPVYGRQFFTPKPQLMQVLPIERELPAHQEALPYQRVSGIIENGQSFAINECICKKEKRLLDHGCGKPLECCMAIAPVPGVFEQDNPWGGRAISREEALRLLDEFEKAGLVHLTGNVVNDQYYICNCCGCCCGVLRSITELGVTGSINSHFFARIEAETCAACGLCANERCQISAIVEEDDAYRILENKCIGCGLCVTTCPTGSITLVRRDEADCAPPPANEDEWFLRRGENRGVDFSKFQ